MKQESAQAKGRRLIQEEEARARREGRVERYRDLGICCVCCWWIPEGGEAGIDCGCPPGYLGQEGLHG